MQQEKIFTEDEIDLRELFEIIWKRKIFIISFSLFITISSAIYAYNKTAIYEVKSIMEIGFLENRIIDDPSVVEQKLNIIFGLEDKNTNNNPEKGIITSIKKDKDVKNFIEIKTEAVSNEIALAKNKEILEFAKQLYSNKIEQFKTFSNNDIINIQREIDYVNNVEIKNLLAQINILKEQEIFKINREIDNLKTQNVENIDKEINILKTQEISMIRNEIEFLSNTKIKAIREKVSFNLLSLEKYISELEILNKNINKNDNSSALITSTQILNYQNLISSTQNQIKDLELQIETIMKDNIPKLKFKVDNINNVQIENLETQKRNIFAIQIKDLEIKKQNVSNDMIKKIEDKINIELKTKISQLEEKMNTTKFKLSEENLSNSKLVGNYIINDFPIKPKKALIIMVSFISSFILAIFLVFILNFIKNTKD